MKGDDLMRRSYFDKEYTFRLPRPEDILSPVPIIITKDNHDGTFQGKYDFKRMSTIQKIMYHPIPSI